MFKALGRAVTHCLAARKRDRRYQQARPCHLESLESRQLLTGFGTEAVFDVEVTSDVVYRDDAEVGFGTPGGVTTTELKLDIYTPSGPGLPDELPAAILVHGGGFLGGDKTKENTVELANDFASRGYLTVSINYRLLGDRVPPAPNPPVDADPRFDAIIAGIEDTFHAIDWLKSSADELGVDPDRIVLGGPSAGAILSMYVGMIDPPDLVGVTDMDLDISGLDVAGVLDMAGSIDGFEHAIDANDPPTFIGHSTDDPTVSIDKAITIANELTADDVPFEFPTITGAGHSLTAKLDTVVDGTTVREQMFDFFQEHLDLEGLLPQTNEWSVSTTSAAIHEDTAGTESLIISLSGTVAEGSTTSIRLGLRHVSTSSRDFEAVRTTVFRAVQEYDGPGTLSLSRAGRTLLYTGGPGGTSLSDLMIPMPVRDDVLVEGDESFIVTLRNPTNADLGQSQQSVTILDNDQTVPSTSTSAVTVLGGSNNDRIAVHDPEVSLATERVSNHISRRAVRNLLSPRRKFDDDYETLAGVFAEVTSDKSLADRINLLD